MANKFNPNTRSGKVLPGKGSPPSMWLDGVANETLTKNQIVYCDSHPVTGTAIQTTDKGANVRRKFGVATSATKKKALGSLYIVLNAAASGDTVSVCPIGILNNLDTSLAATGDIVYLSTAGAPTLTAPTSGYTRIIGEVTGVGVSGTGLWNFAPHMIASGSGLAGSASTASTAQLGTQESNTNFDKAFTVPASTLKVGSVIEVYASGLYTSTTGAETHQFNVMFGATSIGLTGTIDPADNDTWEIRYTGVIRTIGATGTIVGSGQCLSGPRAANASPTSIRLMATGATSTSTTTIDTTVASDVTIALDRQAAAADTDSARMDVLFVRVSNNIATV